jgi:hypothetical protein
MDEKRVTIEDVEREHLDEVNRAAHWVYVVAVLGISFLLMLGFIALLGAATT